jgi:hypothetical protein
VPRPVLVNAFNIQPRLPDGTRLPQVTSPRSGEGLEVWFAEADGPMLTS